MSESVWTLYKSRNDHDYVMDHVYQRSPLPLGIPALDEALAPAGGTGGAPSGIPTVIAGEPGTGKSALATNACYNGVFSGVLPMFFTVEMPRQMVISRMLSIHTKVKRDSEAKAGVPERVMTPQVWWSTTNNVVLKKAGHMIETEEEATAYINDHAFDDPVIRAWYDFEASVWPNMMVVDTYVDAATGETSTALTADRICEMVENVIVSGYPNVFPIIDYLQLTLDGNEKEYEAVNHASSAYRELAKKYNIPLLLLSSMRNVNAQERKEAPTLSQLKGSGNIGYDAGTVIVLRRDGERQKGPQGSETPVRAHVIKNRVGPPGAEVPLMFNGGLNAFR